MSDGDVRETDERPGVPDWEDEYLDRIGDRLMYSYDLERDRRVEGERFALYGRMDVENRKQFLHPSISYGHHEKTAHLFVRRADRVSMADVERLESLGERLAGEWIEPDDQHFETEFVFGLVVPDVPDDVASYVSEFESRTLLKYGLHGHYWIRFFLVAPDSERLVASPGTDVAAAFRLWEEAGAEERERGALGRLRSVFSRRS